MGHWSAAVAKPPGRFPGEADVAGETAQGRQGRGPFLAAALSERRYQYTSEGRISTAPP